MAKSPQLGYNHNIPHRGRLYHIQTEDSGLEKAHIFTHVFFDGTIIASNKIKYDPEFKTDNLDQHIVGLMQKSHKSIIRQLRKGEFDKKIVTYIGEHPEESGQAAASVDPAAKSGSVPPPIRKKAIEVPTPREVEAQGPSLSPSESGPTVDPVLNHPVFASSQALSQLESAAADSARQTPRRGPGRIQRRVMQGIGGKGVSAGADPQAIAARRDIIVGKFASEHQLELDEAILTLLNED